MGLIFFNKYLFANCSSFLHICYGVPSLFPREVKIMEIIIFMIGTYSFNIFSIIKAINAFNVD